MLSLRDNSVAVCGKDIYSLDGCAGTTMQFCRKSNITTCAQQLVAGVTAECRTTFGELDPLQEIDDGMVIINDSTATVTSESETISLKNGTYLVMFPDKASINETTFVNRNGLQIKEAEIPWATRINITGHDNIMSLPYLRHRALVNRQLMEQLTDGYEKGLTTTSIILMVIIIIAVLFSIITFYKR
uniref:Retrovirus-related Env polyprotein from transposon gypsy n=1 Tax=Bactrocera latifrons TaxID=174628 RepID=A0A0K8VEV9_BACLA